MNAHVLDVINAVQPWVSPHDQGNWEPWREGIVAACGILAETALRYVPPCGTILDYGCGPLNKTAVLSKLGYRCTGYDLYLEGWHQDVFNKLRRFAHENSIDLNIGGELPDRPFDMVMSVDVLEHLPEPKRIFEQLVQRIAKSGILVTLVPNAGNIRKRLLLLSGGTNMPRFDEFWNYPPPFVGHVREYVRGDLKAMARYLGLEIVELRGVDCMMQKVPKAIRFPYLAGTALFDSLKDTWLMVARKP